MKMKCSMSMSCLEASPAKVLKTPDPPKKQNNSRLCYSLSSKKARRNIERKFNIRFGSSEEMSQEELWNSCFQTVQLGSDSDSREGNSVREFLEDYSQISDWLNYVQEVRSRFADPLVLSKLAEDMQRKQDMQKEMNERGSKLAQNLPRLKEEFQWRLKHMNSQWDSLKKILLCQSSAPNGNHSCATSLGRSKDCDIEWVSRWLREMENEIQPLTFNVDWTTEQIEAALAKHQALQAEIGEKSSVVHGALRSCRTASQGQAQASRKRVEVLERRWIQLRLRVLEWVEHLSRIQQKHASNKSQGRVSEGSNFFRTSLWQSSDEETSEPLSKIAKIGSSNQNIQDAGRNHQSPTNQGRETLEGIDATAEKQRMGQNHEVGTVCQPGSPVPNSVIEFSFDGLSSGSGRSLKRKISSPSLSVQSVQKRQGESPVTVRMNISTYYFKHSDTEVEGHGQAQNTNPENSVPNHQPVGPVNQGKKARTSDENSYLRKCQKSLDFGQNEKISPSQQHLLTRSAFEFDLREEMDETLGTLGEIEELVEKAEELVKGAAGGKGSSSGGIFPLVQDYSLSLLRKYGRKYENLDWMGSGGGGEGCEKMGNGCACVELEGVGAVGGLCSCGAGGQDLKIKPKTHKKHSRVRQWIKAHNNHSIIDDHKNTSSCDASCESGSDEGESEEFTGEESIEEEPLLHSSKKYSEDSDDDPTILTASTTLLLQQQQQPIESQDLNHLSCVGKHGSSHGSLKSGELPPQSSIGGTGGQIVWRTKQSNPYNIKQRPKSFTDTFTLTTTPPTTTFRFEGLRFGKALSPIHDLNQKQAGVFVSDSALNEKVQSESVSEEDSPSTFDGLVLKERRKAKSRRRLCKQKKRASLDLELEDELDLYLTSTSFAGGFAEMEHQLEDIENTLPTVLKPVFRLNQSEDASVNTEELLLHQGDQDWDSYQEKYLSEPYSEEPYDQDRTLKLLAFGEDYDQVLERADSEVSSVLSGFHQSNHEKRPLHFITRGEMAESDSDRDEFNHFLIQSLNQLRFVDTVFRKQLTTATLKTPHAPSEYAEMEATCEENINSLKLILNNVEKPESLSFEIDVKSIQDVLDNWDLLKDRIAEAGKLQQIHSDLKFLRKNFEGIQRDLVLVDPFDSKDLSALQSKIDRIQIILDELSSKKGKLQSVNEASVRTQIYLKDVNRDVRKQLKNLYALYEENFQLGSYLLDKMRFLEEAWTSFEQERDAFEKSLLVSSSGRQKGKKSLSSGASTDSGHGTDFSQDSSISDSDMDEKRQKLVALRQRALDLKAFLPIGSSVLEAIDLKINETNRDFEMMEKISTAPLNLKLIYPKRKSPVSNRKPVLRSSKSPLVRSSISLNRPRLSLSPVRPLESRHWRTIRFSLTFHLALMGLFAVAWFLQPRCCENMNTFSLSLVPHLTHDRIPHM